MIAVEVQPLESVNRAEKNGKVAEVDPLDDISRSQAHFVSAFCFITGEGLDKSIGNDFPHEVGSRLRYLQPIEATLVEIGDWVILHSLGARLIRVGHAVVIEV